MPQRGAPYGPGNNHESQNNYRVVSSIRRQVLDKKIWISLHQLLEIVKPEAHQELINSIANPDIPKKRIQCEVKRKCQARKKLIFNDTASESSSTSESGSSSESSNDDEDFTVDV
ncbi:1728_t:CDS:1, partial [Acaulospora colombiana]